MFSSTSSQRGRVRTSTGRRRTTKRSSHHGHDVDHEDHHLMVYRYGRIILSLCTTSLILVCVFAQLNTTTSYLRAATLREDQQQTVSVGEGGIQGVLSYYLSSLFQQQQQQPVDIKNNITVAATKDNNNDGGSSRNSQQQLQHPFFSIKPLKKSLHPKYKLWDEFSTPEEQDAAIQMVGQAMLKYGKLIAPPHLASKAWKDIKHGTCQFTVEDGLDHKLCGPKPSATNPGEGCSFISFGINDDPSFDIFLGGKWGCRGFAGDPTVHHPSKLHENVTFHNIGLTTLQDNEERLINKGGSQEWWTTSLPKLRYFLGLDHINVIKIDCEGCEVAMARDIIREDPTFLHRVDQISIETHVTKTWMTTSEHIYYFGLMLLLLEEAGFVMEWSSVFGCSKRHEITGCLPELEQFGWPCGYSPWRNHPNVVLGRSCQEFTWKRYNSDTTNTQATPEAAEPRTFASTSYTQQ